MAGNNILTATSISPQVLVSQQLGTVDAALYTTAASTSVKVSHAVICNTSTGGVNVSLSVIKSSGTVGDGTHRIISSYTLAANDSLSLRDYLDGAMLGPGDIISGFASVASAVDIVISGTVHA